MVAIGIDLGTNNCRVAAYERGIYFVISDRNKCPTTNYITSIVTDLIFGGENETSTRFGATSVCDEEQLLGHYFYDDFVENRSKNSLSSVVNKNGKPTITVIHEGKTRYLTLEEVLVKLLANIKAMVEERTNQIVTSTVIVVPAYFNDHQRQATKNAATLAGLSNFSLFTEPKAVSTLFWFHNRSHRKLNVLIYDLGGGTLDVSMVTVEKGDIKVKATSSDKHLGGHEFDNKLLEHFIAKIQSKFDINLRDEKYKKSLRRMKCACEEAKVTLSSGYKANLKFEALFDAKNVKSSITREKFEKITYDLMLKSINSIEECLKDAHVAKTDIDFVICFGSSTKIPKIASLVEPFFAEYNTRTLFWNGIVDPDNSIACGAAIRAAVLNGDHVESSGGFTLSDVIPLSYGIGTEDGLMRVIIPRNTPYPVKRTIQTIVRLNDTQMGIEIYQGDRELVRDNYFLGGFISHKFSKNFVRNPTVDLTMEIDENGILLATAIEKSSGVKFELRDNVIRKLSKEEIQSHINEANKMTVKDVPANEVMKALSELRVCIDDLRETINAPLTNSTTKELLNGVMADTWTWYLGNLNATKKMIDDKKDELVDYINLMKGLGVVRY